MRRDMTKGLEGVSRCIILLLFFINGCAPRIGYIALYDAQLYQ